MKSWSNSRSTVPLRRASGLGCASSSNMVRSAAEIALPWSVPQRRELLTNKRPRELLLIDPGQAWESLHRLRDEGFLEQRGQRGRTSYRLSGSLRPPAGLRLSVDGSMTYPRPRHGWADHQRRRPGRDRARSRGDAGAARSAGQAPGLGAHRSAAGHEIRPNMTAIHRIASSDGGTLTACRTWLTPGITHLVR